MNCIIEKFLKLHESVSLTRILENLATVLLTLIGLGYISSRKKSESELDKAKVKSEFNKGRNTL